jgi:hypothetical protein
VSSLTELLREAEDRHGKYEADGAEASLVDVYAAYVVRASVARRPTRPPSRGRAVHGEQEPMNHSRRTFVGAAALSVVAAELGVASHANAQGARQMSVKSGTHQSFPPLKQVDAGVLSVAYAELGPANGPPVVLLHGWPYDIYSFVDVAPILARRAIRSSCPYVRGYGPDALSFKRDVS